MLIKKSDFKSSYPDAVDDIHVIHINSDK